MFPKASILKLVLLVGDVFLLYAALFLALIVRQGSLSFFGGEQWNQLVYHFSFVAPFWLLLLFVFDFYEAPYSKKIFEMMRDGLTVLFLAFGAGVIYFYFRSHLVISPKTILFLHLFIFILLAVGWRHTLSRVLGRHSLGARQDTKQLSLAEINEEWFMEYVSGQGKFDKAARGFVDVLAALLGFLLLIFSLPIIAATIKFTSPGPIFYTQKRIGKDGKTFTLYKFRTMVKDAEKDGPRWAGENDKRITGAGRFLRVSNLDELPQAINLLRGDLSLVGPRPERPEFTELLEREIPHYNLRHLVKPGVLGWAQLNYSYGDSVEDAREKLKYELYYIKNRSLFLDLAIIVKSIKIILFARGQ